MRYVSTRGIGGTGAMSPPRAFCDILLEGLAPDGGLYVPQQVPVVDAATLVRWRRLTYPQLAFEIFGLYIDDIPRADLERLCHAVYRAQIFGSAAITPLKPLAPGLALQALSNGPTLAFKDVAMQMLGALFEYELARRGQRLNILGATSGDTGSAAEYAMRGKKGITVFMLSPHGRMSAFQQAQMFSLQDANIHNLAIEGVFDDCQDIVKSVGQDTAFKSAHAIGTVNSINWARLLAQVVYYFAGYFQATTSNDQHVSFAVPSGNFGNVCAGHFARCMGLPIGRLVVATNENDVLDEFFRTGTYRPRAANQTHETSSPSMDISKASNFERFVFDVVDRDADALSRLFTHDLPQRGAFTLDSAAMSRVRDTFGFTSGRSTHADRLATIRRCWEQHGTLIDPHTADGLKVALEHQREGETMLVLETALPAKFAETIREALDRDPPRPAGFDGIEALPKRFTVLPADEAAVRRWIEVHANACPELVEGPDAASRPSLMSLDAALDALLAAAHPLRVDDTQAVSTFDALGRVLAHDLVSPIDVPPADNTSMDGYAMRVADVAQAGTVLPVSQRIPAGTAPQPLAAGTAARIFTGAFIPPGADAVVMQEQCEPVADGKQVRVGIVPQPRQWIRDRGEDVRRGDAVLAAGTLLTPQALGLAAGIGAATLPVRRRVRVALMSTGDELVMPGDVPPDQLPFGAIYNSNRFTLRGLLTACGCEVSDLGIVPDKLDATIARLRDAGQGHDLIVSTGGVSVGEEDHVRPALAAVGHVALWQLAIKPGKPLAFGAVRRQGPASGEALFLGLPGNPVSSFVTFLLAALPLIRALQGSTVTRAQPLPMRADFDWAKPDAKRREFIRVRRNHAGGLDVFPNQSSGVLTSAVWGDGLADLSAGQVVKRGDTLPFIPWSAFGL